MIRAMGEIAGGASITIAAELLSNVNNGVGSILGGISGISPTEVIIIGGGAAGFFTAINCAEKNKNTRVTILEKSDKVLGKVRVSGGGRCNVTHA